MTAVFVTSHLAKNDEKWFLISCVNLRKATISFVTSVRPFLYAWTEFHETWYLIIFEHLTRKLNFRVNLTIKIAV